jgi:hypothetical protein
MAFERYDEGRGGCLVFVQSLLNINSWGTGFYFPSTQIQDFPYDTFHPLASVS